MYVNKMVSKSMKVFICVYFVIYYFSVYILKIKKKKTVGADRTGQLEMFAFTALFNGSATKPVRLF